MSTIRTVFGCAALCLAGLFMSACNDEIIVGAESGEAPPEMTGAVSTSNTTVVVSYSRPTTAAIHWRRRRAA